MYAGDALDVSDQIAVARTDDLANLRVVAGRVGLHLRLETRAIRKQLLNVGGAYRV